ncbi:phosphatase PAP2 family protein [Georgenia yuyongxinii]|uniref:Phosphatase PAP2 family protein n=1 Tax=Georgenia yuyongxinii TaxID=2589797 RepID=A0A552WVL9_9MICO|nr:phosphatase PAP2 family protein [Georgenia yuyongxinii]
MRAVTVLAGTTASVTLAVLVAMWLYRRTGGWTWPALLLAAMAAQALLAATLKILTARPRPPLALELGAPARTFAFPSGHTLSGGTLALTLGLAVAATTARRTVRVLAGALALIATAAVAASRIYLGYHWLTDVVASALLAAAITALCATVAALLPATSAALPARDRITPTATTWRAAGGPGGQGPGHQGRSGRGAGTGRGGDPGGEQGQAEAEEERGRMADVGERLVEQERSDEVPGRHSEVRRPPAWRHLRDHERGQASQAVADADVGGLRHARGQPPVGDARGDESGHQQGGADVPEGGGEHGAGAAEPPLGGGVQQEQERQLGQARERGDHERADDQHEERSVAQVLEVRAAALHDLGAHVGRDQGQGDRDDSDHDRVSERQVAPEHQTSRGSGGAAGVPPDPGGAGAGAGP